MAVNADWGAIGRQLGGVFSAALKELLDAGAAELSRDGMARQLGLLSAEAIRSGDPEQRELAKANIPWLLQYYRLKAINVSNAALDKLFDIVTNVGSALLGGLIP